jgi:hypothetical protein
MISAPLDVEAARNGRSFDVAARRPSRTSVTPPHSL